MPANFALERLSDMRAIGGALGLAFGKKDSGIPKSVKDDQRDAYVAE